MINQMPRPLTFTVDRKLYRVNFEWVAPWLHGKPISTWMFHKYSRRSKVTPNVKGFVILGLHISLSRPQWGGVGFSINW